MRIPGRCTKCVYNKEHVTAVCPTIRGANIEPWTKNGAVTALLAELRLSPCKQKLICGRMCWHHANVQFPIICPICWSLSQ